VLQSTQRLATARRERARRPSPRCRSRMRGEARAARKGVEELPRGAYHWDGGAEPGPSGTSRGAASRPARVAGDPKFPRSYSPDCAPVDLSCRPFCPTLDLDEPAGSEAREWSRAPTAVTFQKYVWAPPDVCDIRDIKRRTAAIQRDRPPFAGVWPADCPRERGPECKRRELWWSDRSGRPTQGGRTGRGARAPVAATRWTRQTQTV
jgi:hypothetical protein